MATEFHTRGITNLFLIKIYLYINCIQLNLKMVNNEEIPCTKCNYNEIVQIIYIYIISLVHFTARDNVRFLIIEKK